MRPLTHFLTQRGSGNSMKDWATNFGVQIGFEDPPPLRRGFAKFCTLPSEGVDVKKKFLSITWLKNDEIAHEATRL